MENRQLIELLKHEDDDVRCNAIVALTKRKSDDAIPHIINMLKNERHPIILR